MLSYSDNNCHFRNHIICQQVFICIIISYTIEHLNCFSIISCSRENAIKNLMCMDFAFLLSQFHWDNFLEICFLFLGIWVKGYERFL